MDSRRMGWQYPSYLPGSLSVGGAFTLGGNVTLTGGGDIVGDGTIRLLPTGAYITQVGDAGSTSHTLNANDDLFVAGKLEVDGAAFFDGGIQPSRIDLPSMVLTGTEIGITVGGIKGRADMGIMLAPLATDGVGCHNTFLAGYANFSVANTVLGTAQTNPTLWVFSATDWGTATDQWWRVSHNQTDAIASTGKGGKILSPYSGAVYFDSASQASKAFGVKVFHQIVTLDTGDAETLIGLTPTAVILAAAIRVSTQITGLDSADHSVQLGTGSGDVPDKYCSASQGGAATTIDVNKKASYSGLATAVEVEPLILTIVGGADNIPSAGAVEVLVAYLYQTDLPSV